MRFIWHPVKHSGIVAVHYKCWGQRRWVTANLRHSQLALWHGTNFRQLHRQLHAVRDSRRVALHLHHILGLPRPLESAGNDLDQIRLGLLCGPANDLGGTVLLRSLGRGDLSQEGSWSLTGCEWEKPVGGRRRHTLAGREPNAPSKEVCRSLSE